MEGFTYFAEYALKCVIAALLAAITCTFSKSTMMSLLAMILISLTTGQPFIVHFLWTIIVSKDHTQKWYQGRAENSVP